MPANQQRVVPARKASRFYNEVFYQTSTISFLFRKFIKKNIHTSLPRIQLSYPESLICEMWTVTVPPSPAAGGSNKLSHRKCWVLCLASIQFLINAIYRFITKHFKTTDKATITFVSHCQIITETYINNHSVLGEFTWETR